MKALALIVLLELVLFVQSKFKDVTTILTTFGMSAMDLASQLFEAILDGPKIALQLT